MGGTRAGLYEFVDRPTGMLCTGSRLMLWSLRCWTEAVARGACPGAALAPFHASMGLVDAVPDLCMAAGILNRDARINLALAPVSACCIAEDEAALVALWRDVALGAPHASAFAHALVEDAMAAPLMKAIGAHGARLAAAGFMPAGAAIRETSDE